MDIQLFTGCAELFVILRTNGETGMLVHERAAAGHIDERKRPELRGLMKSKKVTTEHDGKTHHGTYLVKDGIITVRSALGEKSTGLGNLEHAGVASMLLRELIVRGVLKKGNGGRFRKNLSANESRPNSMSGRPPKYRRTDEDTRRR